MEGEFWKLQGGEQPPLCGGQMERNLVQRVGTTHQVPTTLRYSVGEGGGGRRLSSDSEVQSQDRTKVRCGNSL